MPTPIITLLTDFGGLDPYVGVMKGVVAGIAPQARLIDLTHAIPPGDVRRAAYALYESAPYFPTDAVHLAVVDPGVGSARRPIAVSTDHGNFVGPDNGVFTYILALFECRAVVELVNPRYRRPAVSHTFHGRDLFSPAAAHLANGVAIEHLGPSVSDPVRFPLPRLEERAPGEIAVEALHADRFGNLITSLGVLDWQEAHTIRLSPWLPNRVAPRRFSAADAQVSLGPAAPRIDGIRKTFADVPEGQPVAMLGSDGHLEIAVNRGNAAQLLGIGAGDEVILRFREV